MFAGTVPIGDQPLPTPKKCVLWLLLLDLGMFLLMCLSAQIWRNPGSQLGMGIASLSFLFWGYLYFNPGYTRSKQPFFFKVMWPRPGVDILHLALVTINLFFLCLGFLMLILLMIKHSPSTSS